MAIRSQQNTIIRLSGDLHHGRRIIIIIIRRRRRTAIRARQLIKCKKTTDDLLQDNIKKTISKRPAIRARQRVSGLLADTAV